MANKLKEVMKPILKQKCSEAYQVGYQKGVENGWKGKSRAYDNQIEFLKTMLDAFRSKDMVEVVRCKNCKYFLRHTQVNTDKGDCACYGIGCCRVKHIDDYCSKGRKENL